MTGDAHDRTVAVVTVTRDAAGDLPDFFACLAALSGPPLELAIVDCASGDGSAELARRGLPPGLTARVIALDANAGFAGGLNLGIRSTRAPWVLSLNADARPEPDFLERLLERAARSRGERVGCLTGRLLRFAEADGPDRLDACGMRLTPTWRHLDRGSGRVDRGQYLEPEEVFGATGAAALYRREALIDVAVDGEVALEEFHSFREDAELCFRLRERGWRVLYEPSARARHRRSNLPGRRARMSAAINYHSLKNRYLLRAYHQTARNFVATLLPALARDLMALAWVVLRERSSLAAYAWLWRARRSILARRRVIQGRRTVPPGQIDRWFLRDGMPV